MAQHRYDDQPSAPARFGRKRGGQAQGIGRSRGGLSSKVHLVVDALGLPLEFRVTEGQRHDVVHAEELVARAKSRCVLGDKAFDSNAFRAALARDGVVAVIPPTTCRARRGGYDRDLYRARCEVECTFNLLKQARRFATRYEKTLRNYLAVVALGCTWLWLRI